MSTYESFEGRTVLITGASVGIGAEFAAQMHAKGARVVLVARRRELLEQQAAHFNHIRPDSAQIICADIATDEISQVLDFLHREVVHVVVNNAGRGSFGRFHELSIEQEVQMVALNVVATMRIAHAAIPAMRQRGEGAIVSVSSVAGHQPLPYNSTYAATKAFNLFHSLGLREELRGSGVRVVTVCPGPVETEFNGVARIPGTANGGPRESPQVVVRESLSALARNQPVVVPGWRAKWLWFWVTVLPRRVSMRIVGYLLKQTLTRAEGAK